MARLYTNLGEGGAREIVYWRRGTGELAIIIDLSYYHHMKKPVSVTLSPENLMWLRAQAARAHRSLSETLDRLLEDLRAGGGLRSISSRSVVGLVRISPKDPDLRRADASVRELFDHSLDRAIDPRSKKRKRPRARGRK